MKKTFALIISVVISLAIFLNMNISTKADSTSNTYEIEYSVSTTQEENIYEQNYIKFSTYVTRHCKDIFGYSDTAFDINRDNEINSVDLTLALRDMKKAGSNITPATIEKYKMYLLGELDSLKIQKIDTYDINADYESQYKDKVDAIRNLNSHDYTLTSCGFSDDNKLLLRYVGYDELVIEELKIPFTESQFDTDEIIFEGEFFNIIYSDGFKVCPTIENYDTIKPLINYNLIDQKASENSTPELIDQLAEAMGTAETIWHDPDNDNKWYFWTSTNVYCLEIKPAEEEHPELDSTDFFVLVIENDEFRVYYPQ